MTETIQELPWRLWWNGYEYMPGEDTPYHHDVVEIRRPPENKVNMVCPRSLPPWFNIAGLEWRPVP